MYRKQPSLIQSYLKILILSIVLTSSGCETIIDVNLPEHTPVLVANSLFNPDSVWSVRLFQSKSSLDNSPIKIVSNATVTIVDERGSVATLTHVRDGFYRAGPNQSPQIEEVYTLFASAPGFALIKAVDHVPNPVPIKAVDADLTSIPFKLTIHFTDPPDEKNYYQILVLQSGGNENNELWPVWFETDDLIFQELDDIDWSEAFFDDSLISGQNYKLKLRAYPFRTELQTPTYVALLSVSESFFKYMRSSRSQQENGDNPFSMPVQVYNNVENGLGIFAGFSVSLFVVF